MTDKARPESKITEGLRDWRDNRRNDSADALLKLVYTELHRQAHRYLQKERVGHTLQTTALVHEAYLRLVEQKSVAWESRSHFYAIAATMMRRILIDYARTKHRVRRGGVNSDHVDVSARIDDGGRHVHDVAGESWLREERLLCVAGGTPVRNVALPVCRGHAARARPWAL